MKHQPTLPTKRQPIRKSVLKRLFANIPGRKKHRASTTANPADFETEMPGRRIGNALAVILAVHVAAAGLVFFHHWRLEGRGGDAAKKTVPEPMLPASLYDPGNTAPAPQRVQGEPGHMVRAGETYSSIAEKLGVLESDLRGVNDDRPIQSGLVLKLPPNKIVAKESPEVTKRRANEPPADRGNVEIPRATPVFEEPQLVRPSAQKVTEHSAAQTEKSPSRMESTLPKPSAKPAISTPKPAVGSRSYTVKAGDNFWSISNRFKVDQAQLMKANGITDAKKLKIGMNLVIPN